MKRNRWLSVICAVAVLALSGCTFSNEGMFANPAQDSSRNSSDSKSEQSSREESSEPVITDDSERLAFSMKNTLNAEQRKLYNRFVSGIESYETEFHFENVEQDDLKKVYFAVLDDHPEYFWLGKSYVYRSSTLGDHTSVTISPDLMSDDPEELRTLAKKMKAATDQIVQDAKAQGSLYEQVTYVHDYLVDNTDYDTDAVEQIGDASREGVLNASTAYGCLLEHRAICSGYAAAFQLLCTELGAECYRVSGTRLEQEGAHQWNFLQLDDEYYYTDVTWDDPVRADGVKVRTYEYFMISDDDLVRTHTMDNERPVPACEGTKYNYYVYHGLYFQKYDFSDMQDAVERLPEGELTVKFSTPEQRDLAEADLMDNRRIFELPGFRGGVTYSLSASGCILTIRNSG